MIERVGVFMKSFFKLFMLSSMFVACGAQPQQEETAASPAVVKSIAQPSATVEPTMPVSLNLDALANLPECTEQHEGVLAFVRESHDFYLCESLAWTALDARGEKGDAGSQGIAGVGVQGAQGIQGADGTNGTDGTNGIDNHIATRWECTGVVNEYPEYFGALPTYAYTAEYAVNVTTYGDVMISARIMNLQGQWAFSKSLPRDHVDANTAKIQSRTNLVGGSVNCGIWTLTLNRSTDQMTIRYDDADMASLGGVYSKAVSCTKTTY